MTSYYQYLPDVQSVGKRFVMPDNARLMPGQFREVTEYGFGERLRRFACYLCRVPPLVAFAVMFKDNKQPFPSDLLWMEYDHNKCKYMLKKALPISAIKIFTDEREKTITISMGPGKFQKYQIYEPSFDGRLRFGIWEGLNVVRRLMKNPTLTEKLLHKFTFNNPFLTPEINGVDIRGYMDVGAEISLMSTSCFLKHWTKNDLSSSEDAEPLLQNLRANSLFKVRGIFRASVVTGKHVYPRRVFAVADNISNDLIIGMNILKDMYPELADPIYV